MRAWAWAASEGAFNLQSHIGATGNNPKSRKGELCPKSGFVQKMENEAYFLAALQRHAEARAAGVANAVEISFETQIEPTSMRGIHREPKPGALQQQGSKRVPQPYIFIGGKRVSTGRKQRFAKT